MILEMERVKEVRAQHVKMKKLLVPIEDKHDGVSRDTVKCINLVIDLCDTVLAADARPNVRGKKGVASIKRSAFFALVIRSAYFRERERNYD